jgi:hypothetical protein
MLETCCCTIFETPMSAGIWRPTISSRISIRCYPSHNAFLLQLRNQVGSTMRRYIARQQCRRAAGICIAGFRISLQGKQHCRHGALLMPCTLQHADNSEFVATCCSMLAFLSDVPIVQAVIAKRSCIDALSKALMKNYNNITLVQQTSRMLANAVKSLAKSKEKQVRKSFALR